MKTVVLHHADNDGFGAAYAHWMLGKDQYQELATTYIPVQYGQIVPRDVYGADEVYILDFSYSREIVEEIKASCGNLVIIDHHKTAQEALAGLPYAHFNMEKSGAVLAWEYFIGEGTKVPLILQYVQDYDLWKFEMHNSREVNLALSNIDLTFNAWFMFDFELRTSYESIVSAGIALNRYKNRLIDSICAKAEFKDEHGHKVAQVYTPILQSDVGSELAASCDYVRIYSKDLNQKLLIVSLRSKGDFDVSEIAKKFGGGGHKNAAGYTLPILY